VQDTFDLRGRLAGIDLPKATTSLLSPPTTPNMRVIGARRNAFLRSLHALEERLPAVALWPHRPGHSESKRVELNLSVTLEPDGRADVLRLVVPGSARTTRKLALPRARLVTWAHGNEDQREIADRITNHRSPYGPRSPLYRRKFIAF